MISMWTTFYLEVGDLMWNNQPVNHSLDKALGAYVVVVWLE
jgi:hypothetical protein